MFVRLFSLLTLTLCLAAPALAQEPPASVEDVPTEAPASDELLGNYTEDVTSAAAKWTDALAATPRLVSLQAQSDAKRQLRDQLADRLKLLGEKTFSNREWKSYWEQQATTADALAAAMSKANAPRSQLDGLAAWSALAKEKMVNQDKYFAAIESERDALEDRLEATLEAKAATEDTVDAAVSDPNPYERRRIRLLDLESRIEAQTAKRDLANSEIAFIERQLESEAILATALDKDLELAQTELKIANGQASSESPWGLLWAGLATKSAHKVEKIHGESQYGRQRERSRQVELGLSTSQVDFRKDRIAHLKAEHKEAGSASTWIAATWETMLEWLRLRAWKIVIGLFFVYIGVRFALRMTTHAVKLILERTDDDPDVDDDADQRRETLAEVFSGVTRIAIYIVGGLIALEQIGINTGPILGSVAILGLAISFGSQNLVRDVVNGFFILLENQYAVGDVVTINGKTGGVEKITIRSTWVRSWTGDLHCIPNGSINLVSNLTRGWARAHVEIGVAYDSDLKLVRDVINRVGEEMYADAEWKDLLEEAPQWVGVTALQDSAVEVRCQVKVGPGQQWGAERELNHRLKLAFDQADRSRLVPLGRLAAQLSQRIGHIFFGALAGQTVRLAGALSDPRGNPSDGRPVALCDDGLLARAGVYQQQMVFPCSPLDLGHDLIQRNATGRVAQCSLVDLECDLALEQ